MILLAVTVCMAADGDARCERHIELLPTVAECREKGDLHVDYVRAADPDARRVIWTGWKCEAGHDG